MNPIMQLLYLDAGPSGLHKPVMRWGIISVTFAPAHHTELDTCPMPCYENDVLRSPPDQGYF